MRMLTKLGFRSMSLLVRTKIDAMLPGHKQNYCHASRVTWHVPRMPTVQMVGRMTPSVHQSTRVAMALGSKSRSGSGASELLPRVWFNASLRFLTCSRPWSSHRQLAGPVCSCTWHQPSGNWMLLKVGALKTNFEIKIINVHIISDSSSFNHRQQESRVVHEYAVVKIKLQ